MPAQLSHHLEQGNVGGDGAAGVKNSRIAFISPSAWIGNAKAPRNAKVLSGEVRFVCHIGDPTLPCPWRARRLEAQSFGECRLLGHAAKRRKPIRLIDVPARNGTRAGGGARAHMRAPRPTRMCANGHRHTLKRSLRVVLRLEDATTASSSTSSAACRTAPGRPLRDLVPLAARKPIASQPPLDHLELGLRRWRSLWKRLGPHGANTSSSSHWSSPRFMQNGCSIVSRSP